MVEILVMDDNVENSVSRPKKIRFDREFLLSLKNHPLSLKRPACLDNLEFARSRPIRPVAQRLRNKHECTNPFNWRQRSEPVKKHVKVIVIPNTITQEVQLKKAENAWRPSMRKEADDAKAQTEVVVKTVKGIMNKLTPENFERLAEKLKALPINTKERLSAFTDIIYEKAVNELSFSSTYAEMCKVLSVMSVQGKFKFRDVIISKCRLEFEKDLSEELKSNKREIEACTDPEKKRELTEKYSRHEVKMRKRAVGNITFIGELFKLRLLDAPLMMNITRTLLKRRDEESLECLCKFLTTIGMIFERQCVHHPKAVTELDEHFQRIKEIVDGRLTNSRIRCLMMDVMDLRQNKWVPRREPTKPKTKTQIQEDLRREEMNQQMELVSLSNKRSRRSRRRR